MKSNTWAIGESCQGGVITAEIHDNGIVKVIGKEWDTSQGWSRNSDQSKAKPFTKLEGNFLTWGVEEQFDNFLNELTTSYYTSQVIDWIKANL